MASASLPTAHSERPFWPRRNWWLALLVILVLAGALRFPGYDFGLPYVERVGDPERTPFAIEAYYNLAARMILDQGTAKDLHMHNYPPGIIAVNYLTLRFFHDEAEPPTTVLRELRLLSVVVSLITVMVIALFGYRLTGEIGRVAQRGIMGCVPNDGELQPLCHRGYLYQWVHAPGAISGVDRCTLSSIWLYDRQHLCVDVGRRFQVSSGVDRSAHPVRAVAQRIHYPSGRARESGALRIVLGLVTPAHTSVGSAPGATGRI